MKKLKVFVLSFILICFYQVSHAQEQERTINTPDYNKPKLFSDVPDKLNMKLKSADALFDLKVGSSFFTQLADQFSFTGIVISKVDNASFQSIVIKSTNRKGAILSLSKIKKGDGSFIYKGRILSRNNADAFELANENGQYILQKKNYYEIISE